MGVGNGLLVKIVHILISDADSHRLVVDVSFRWRLKGGIIESYESRSLGVVAEFIVAIAQAALSI